MDYRKIAEENQILKVRVGSHLFGTDMPESDTDYEGIFMPSDELVFGFGHCREVDLGLICKDETGRNTSDAIDYKVREYRDFCRLALQNNPNILNIIFANDENVIFCNEFGNRLRSMAGLFPHKGCIQRYKGYAISQMKKMTIKPMNYELLKEAVEFLQACDYSDILIDVIKKRGILYGNSLNPFKDLGPGKHIQVGDIFLERGLKVSRALSIIRGRLDRASIRAEMWEKHGYDLKFSANLIQILMQGIELVKTGRLTFPLEDAGTILSIKNGEYTIGDINEMASRLEEEISVAEDDSSLPSKPRYEEIERLVIMEMRRWFDEN